MPVIYVITNDEEAKLMLNKLAEQDVRSASAEVIWLIRQEWARRYSQRSPLTIEEALEAGKIFNSDNKE